MDRTSGPTRSLPATRLPDAIQVVHRADENLPVGDGRGRAALLAQLVLRHQLKLRHRLHDVRGTVVVREVDVAVGVDRRRAVMPAEALLPEHLAGLRLPAGADAF